jgi:hypothetical protein
MQTTKDQERIWKWERAGWTFMGILLLCGLLEILAPNPVSQAVAHTVGIRPGTSDRPAQATRLEVQVGPEATSKDQLILQVASKHFKNLEVQNIIPAPLRVLTSGDNYEYVFPVRRQNEPLTITFYLQTRRSTLSPGEMGFTTGGTLAFSRFVGP